MIPTPNTPDMVGRITFTKAQLELPEVKELVDLLVGIAADGVISYEELQQLSDWLNAHNRSEIPAVQYLLQLLVNICSDGRLDEGEYFEVQLAIERVLPKQYRVDLVAKRKEVYYNQPASLDQLALLQRITGFSHGQPTRAQASEVITNYLNSPQPASQRQIMFLRFVDRVDLVASGKREISDWMSVLSYTEPHFFEAWARCKIDIGDDGTQRDPGFVPLGGFRNYLAGVPVPR